VMLRWNGKWLFEPLPGRTVRLAAKHACLVGSDLLHQQREDQAAGLVAVQHCAYDQVAQSIKFPTNGSGDRGFDETSVFVVERKPDSFLEQRGSDRRQAEPCLGGAALEVAPDPNRDMGRNANRLWRPPNAPSSGANSGHGCPLRTVNFNCAFCDRYKSALEIPLLRARFSRALFLLTWRAALKWLSTNARSAPP